jgi:hypothetical protein
MCDYRDKWKLIRELRSKYGLVHIARLINESAIIPLSKRDKYVFKILDACDENPLYIRTNIDTVKLNIKLGLIGITPGVLDYGDYPDQSLYFVTKLYMSNGADYICMLNQLYDNYKSQENDGPYKSDKSERNSISKSEMKKLYRAYMTRMIVLYNRLAKIGICTFDTKNENIVVNYNNRYEIIDMRLIDIDCDRIIVVKKPSELTIQVFYTAMMLMNFMVTSLYMYYNKERLLQYYRTAFKTKIIGIYSLDIEDIRSHEVLNEFKKLITDGHIPTWRAMMWCYWHKHSDVDTFTECREAEQDFMFERMLDEIFEIL